MRADAISAPTNCERFGRRSAALEINFLQQIRCEAMGSQVSDLHRKHRVD
jgi:hypothetical protein